MQKSNWLEKQARKKLLKKFIRNNILPAEVNIPEGFRENKDYYIKFLEILGFKKIKYEGSLIFCEFPKGWKYEQTSNSEMFIYLLDNKNRKRASVFFNVFYAEKELFSKKVKVKNFSTFINWLPRFMLRIREQDDKSTFIGEIVDNQENKIIYKTIPKKLNIEVSDSKIIKKQLYDSLEYECKEFLNLHYPNFNNILEYWDDKNYEYEENNK